MSPGARVRQKKQLTLGHFVRQAAKPDLPAPKPTSSARPAPKQSTNTSVRPLPRPTSKPFFLRTPPTRRRPLSHGSTADDAFEIGDRVLRGQCLLPTVQYSDEGAPVATPSPQGDASDASDDDFEPDQTRRQVTRQRRHARHSDLRDDRASMTKRSAKKRTRLKEGVLIPTQRAHVQRSQSVRGTPLAARHEGSINLDEEFEDGDVVVVEGDKSELSATDDAENPASPMDGTPVRHSKETMTFLSPEVVASGCGAGRERKKAQPELETAEECLQHIRSAKADSRNSRRRRQQVDPPKNHAQRRVVGLSSPSKRGLIGDTPNEMRTGDLPKIFSSDSDAHLETYLRARGRSTPTAEASSDSSSEEGEPNQRPVQNAAAQEQFYHTPPATKRNVASRSSVRKAARSSLNRTEQVLVLSDSDEDSLSKAVSSPNANESAKPRIPKTPRKQVRKRLISESSSAEEQNGSEIPTRVAGGLSGERAKRVSLSPESAPSPPSTKKRKRLMRLKACSSDGEEGDYSHVRGIPEITPKSVPPPCFSQAERGTDEVKLEGDEWFHERRIEDFSSSSADFRPTLSEGPMKYPVPKAQKARLHAKPTILPVRRDILKSFSNELAKTGERPSLSVGSASPRRPHRAQILDKADPIKDSNETDDALGNDLGRRDFAWKDAADREQPIIDLIDEDKDGIVPVAERGSDSAGADDIRNTSSTQEWDNLDRPPLASASDAAPGQIAPPPYNLVVLCNPGESIRDMKTRLGEEFVVGKVAEAQKAGRDIIGGEEIGLTRSFNRSVFNRYSKNVVADAIHQDRKAKFVTEQALRGEYKFNFRGGDYHSGAKRGNRRGVTGKGHRGRGRFSGFRKRNQGG